MRLRPIGPGIGGLYYSTLLQDAGSIEKTTQAILRLPRSESANRLPGRAHALWQAFAAATRRFGVRLMQVRQEQADAYLARTTANLGRALAQPSRSENGARYY